MTEGNILNLHLRRRRPAEGTALGPTRIVRRDVPAAQTALLLCDMWDRHWCLGAMRRCDLLAQKMAPVVDAARDRGVHIIHAPSDCQAVYEGAAGRHTMGQIPPVGPPPTVSRDVPALPIDDSDGGCDCATPCEQAAVWTRQHPALRIADSDVISESGTEVYGYLRHHGIQMLLIAGVHTNMCVLDRSFGIRQMTGWGVSCALVRDLTDSLYNPRLAPFVSQKWGTRLVIAHIETHWCPSTLSTDLRVKNS